MDLSDFLNISLANLPRDVAAHWSFGWPPLIKIEITFILLLLNELCNKSKMETNQYLFLFFWSKNCLCFPTSHLALVVLMVRCRKLNSYIDFQGPPPARIQLAIGQPRLSPFAYRFHGSLLLVQGGGMGGGTAIEVLGGMFLWLFQAMHCTGGRGPPQDVSKNCKGRGQTNRTTDRQTDIATYRLDQ